MKSKALAFVIAMLVSSLLAPVAHATVLRVVTVQTEDLDAYVKEVEKGQAIIKKAGGSAILRVWRARYAGSDTGAVVVSIEYPDLVTFANDDKKLGENSDYQNWFKHLTKMRKVVSDSIYDELKS